MKCILAKTKSSYWIRSKFIDLNCLCSKWGNAIFVIPFMFWNKYIPCYPFLSLNNFSFIKKIPTRITPHTGGQEKISMRREKKLQENQKGIKSPRNSNARGHAHITRKSDSQNNDKGQIKEEQQKKMWMMLRVKLLIVILGHWNPKTLFEPYESFSFITKNHILRYIPIEVLSNQASKQPRTINNALKMQRILFHKIHDIKNKLLIIIHADKKWMIQKEINFSHTKPRAFSRALHFETKGHLMMYFHWRPHCQTQEQIISFPRKKITKELQDFKSKLF